MSGETLYERPRKYQAMKMRVHDYLYDSSFIVSGARDYARTSFKAAMTSAQVIIQPVYRTMFSELRKFPRMRVVYHPNCRLPEHIDRSYGAYVKKVESSQCMAIPHLTGKDRFKFSAVPKKLLEMKSSSPEFHPPTPILMPTGPTKPRNRGTQSVYRESSAQTHPWQSEAKEAKGCETKPEVLYLDKLEWGPGSPYRMGDLPADFHTTEIINKMRHARTWNELVEKGHFPRFMKKRDEIISDVETKDWIFREAEIDELQEIRLELLHRMQAEQRLASNARTSNKLNKLWNTKKMEMERKIEHIRHARDRELRKLTALHGGGGRPGLVGRMRAARGGGSKTSAARDPASEMHAPLARHGYQASRRHTQIYYDPSLLSLEDHEAVSKPPSWLSHCGQDLKRSCSGHHLRRDPMQLCERETKWSEQFLENLHNDLKRARMGAVCGSMGPLHVLRPRNVGPPPRPQTPTTLVVPDEEEGAFQDVLLLQRIIRGRAVQNLMYEGRTRAAELTEELKTTHGLQPEDRVRIAKEEAKAREYNAQKTEYEQKEDAISALVDELCGGAVSAALDFLEKELRRLKEERKQHAFILIALREKTMREAAEAGRRQKEELRRREHDEMFKQILGVTQETVDVYFREIVQEGVELAAEEDAVRTARANANRIDQSLNRNGSMSTAEQNELVAELVSQCLLGGASRTAARHRLAAAQAARARAAVTQLFGTLDEGQVKMLDQTCIRCGCPLDETCRCRFCPHVVQPVATTARDDERWKIASAHPKAEEVVRDPGDRFPPSHDFRCMLNTLISEVVNTSRSHRKDIQALQRDVSRRIKEKVEVALDMKEAMDFIFDRATGLTHAPPKVSDYYHYSRRIIGDAMDRSEGFPPEPLPLPSEIRRQAIEAVLAADPNCYCEQTSKARVRVQIAPEELLPSQLRELEELRRCKCDTDPTASPSVVTEVDDFSQTDRTERTTDTPVTDIIENEEMQPPLE